MKSNIKTGNKLFDSNGKFTKGHPPIGGRPKGSLDFKTKFLRAIEKIAEQENILPEDVEDQLISVGIQRAISGDFSFWKELNDRLYGKSLYRQLNNKKPPLCEQ